MTYRLRNQDLYLNGFWVAHIFVSGNNWYGVVNSLWFRGKSADEVAAQIEAVYNTTEGNQ